MATYTWDLGFDWNAVSKGGQYYLQNGFVQFPGSGAPPSPGTPVNLQPGDTVTFFLYNLTPQAATPADYNVDSGSITFKAAEEGQTRDSPFDEATIPVPIGLSTNTSWSTIFSGGTNQSFPQWPLGQYSIVADASLPSYYLMSVSITITYYPDNSVKKFIVDPEMVVGGAG